MTVPKRLDEASLVKLRILLKIVREEGANSTSQFSMASEVLIILLCSSVNEPANRTLEKSIKVAWFSFGVSSSSSSPFPLAETR
jgi:hypothetical protein